MHTGECNIYNKGVVCIAILHYGPIRHEAQTGRYLIIEQKWVKKFSLGRRNSTKDKPNALYDVAIRPIIENQERPFARKRQKTVQTIDRI